MYASPKYTIDETNPNCNNPEDSNLNAINNCNLNNATAFSNYGLTLQTVLMSIISNGFEDVRFFVIKIKS